MAYKQAPGRMNMPKTGRGLDAATLMTGTPAKYTDTKSPKKNTSGVFGGDEIMKDQNKDGNMVSRGFSSLVEAGRKIGKAIASDFSDGGAEAKRKLRIDRDPSITK